MFFFWLYDDVYFLVLDSFQKYLRIYLHEGGRISNFLYKFVIQGGGVKNIIWAKVVSEAESSLNFPE